MKKGNNMFVFNLSVKNSKQTDNKSRCILSNLAKINV